MPPDPRVVARFVSRPAAAAMDAATSSVDRVSKRSVDLGRSAVGAGVRATDVVIEPVRAAGRLATHPKRAYDAFIRHSERRVIVADRRLHVELRPARDEGPDAQAAIDHLLERSVAALPDVVWARVHGPSRRLVVQSVDGADIDGLTTSVKDAIDVAESDAGTSEQRFVDRGHPADEAPIVRDMMGIGADLLGISLGSSLQLLRFQPPPIEVDLAAALNVADQVIPVRRAIERRLGPPLTDLTIGFTNAVVQGVVQGPLGPTVDLGRRVLVFRELSARRHTWLDRERELFSVPAEAVFATVRPPRTGPVPDGPIERYERVALVSSGVGGVATWLMTRRLERAAATLQATLPKAARLGREAFVRELCHHLAGRGVLVMDSAPLLLLDRVDTFAIGRELLGPGGVDLAGLVAAAHRSGLRMLIEIDDDDHPPEGADVVPAGHLASAVADAQDAGGVVALATGSFDATVGADIVLGLTRAGTTAPWGADLVGTDDPTDVMLLLEAIVQARRVTKESVRLAAIGAGGALIVAVGSVVPGRARRAPGVVGVASALSLVNGFRHAYDLARRPLPVRADPTPWHALETRVVLDRLGSGRKGLSSEAAAARLVREPSSPMLPIAFVHAVGDELVNPLTPVLAAGAVMSLMVGSFVDAGLVGGVVMANAVAGGVQNLRAQRALRALSQTEPTEVVVRRDGRRVRVLPAELVQGDVIDLRAGEAVPADCRILKGRSLEVDESALTGESVPVRKSGKPSVSPVLAERTSMLYEGSWVAAGAAKAVVTATGRDTEANRAAMIAGEPPATGVEARLSSWTSRMVPISLLGGGAIVLNGLVRQRPVRETMAAGVSLAVAAVPEGLPLLSTVAQLSAARRLSHHNVLVRNAKAIEAMGRVDVVCADKTGTLTEGRISLRVIGDGVRSAPLGSLPPELRSVLETGLRATPVANDPDDLPHPTDRAIAAGGRANGTHRDWEPDGELAFEPRRGFHAAAGLVSGERVIAVKGAPEVVLPRCTRWRRDGVADALTPTDRRSIEGEVERLARAGLRVLAVAEGDGNGHAKVRDHHVDDLVFVGLLGLADPARKSAAAAVRLLDQAGTRVLMITGDHPSTAEAIGAQLGVLDGGQVVTGEAIDAADDDELRALLERASVFARVTPTHKVRIVKALQASGHTVAMTGDGANDAPAIRLADVGIALGADATPAARNAADIVVLDERIETIVDALVEGRALWGVVRDAVAVLVGGNLGEIAFTVGGSLISGRPPLNARQLLLVNLLTDAAPALAIAARPPRSVSAEQLLHEGPDESLASALDRAIIWRAAATALATGGAWISSAPLVMPRRASTVALVTTVGTQLGQTIATSHRDPLVLAAGLGSAALLATIVQTPGISRLFGCAPLDPIGWATAATWATAGTVASAVLPPIVERARA